jgi:hypothetical protein
MANDVTSKVILGLDPSEFRRGIQQVDAKLKETAKQFNNLGGVIGAAFAGGVLINFAKDAMRLGDELQKVSQGFSRFGGEANLQQLRKATNGLLSDLELMKQATKAGTLGIAIGEMGNLLEFAKRRAQETGQSVDYLVESIVTGIGRKSPLILDNLGISATHLRSKLNGVSVEAASVGEVSRAVGEIATEQLQLMGEGATTASDRIQQLNVRFQNFKAAVGTELQAAALQTFDIFDKFAVYMKGGIFGIRDALLEMNGIITDQTILRARELASAVGAVSPGATEPNRPAGPPALNFGNFSENTLANMRAQVAAFTAELENVGIGTARFKELKAQIDAVQSSIKKLTEPAKKVFVVPTEQASKLVDKGLKPVANGIVFMEQVLRTAGIPAFDEFARMIKGAKDQLELIDQQLQFATAVGAQFGHVLNSAFTAAMNNGTSFFDELQNAIKNYVRQLATAVATTLALSAIVSAFTGMPLAASFRGVAQGTGLGGLFGEGGILNMSARVSGSDLLLGTQRSGNNFTRSGGG